MALGVLLVSPIAFNSFGYGEVHAASKQKAKKIKAPKKRKRPSLSFRPDVSRQAPKYHGKVGVLQLRDRRGFKFYGGSDEFFAEPTLEALNRALYLGTKSGRAFTQVVQVPVQPGTRITRDELKQIAQQYGLDYILMSDLTTFTLLREKMAAKKKGFDFAVKVRFGLFGQLIDPKSGAILWAEPVVREMGQLNIKRKTKAEDYGQSAVEAVKAVMSDMAISIHTIGLEVRQ
ncbi:MAG: hypothetical protein COA84_11015 [Robiginitomaculum sp.]|nr:MAG: hypothetical protein COA84_11015 [Robiginitomaculum sp.]